MKELLRRNKLLLIFVFIVISGSVLRLYNLDWGSPYYFHPDERNIASAVSQFRFPEQLNPNFFAYGSLPLYIMYFTGVLWNIITQFVTYSPQIFTVSFETAILVSRFYSAILSILLLPLLFFVAKLLKQGVIGQLITLSMATFSVGFIQYAHFGTFEMWLSFFTHLFFSILLRYMQKPRLIILLAAAAIFGILTAIKISSFAFFPLFLLTMLFTENNNSLWKRLAVFFQSTLIFISTAILVFVISSPYVFLDFTAFQNSMNYESSVVFGTLPVFYTGGFFETIPVIFSFLFSYPFLINPLFTLFFIPAFCYVLFLSIKKKNKLYLLLLAFYLFAFIPQTILFAKWTRYLLPSLPFLYLILSIFLTAFARKFFYRISRSLHYVFLSIVISVGIFFSIAYIFVVHYQNDTRMQAVQFANQYIPEDAVIVSEVYDLGITPFHTHFSSILLFNFYDLEHDPQLTYSLQEALEQSEYLILPSQRILRSRLLHPEEFPIGHTFYKNLFSGELSYEKIYETPCTGLCTILYMGDPHFHVEETVDIFDRPTVYIFKKIK